MEDEYEGGLNNDFFFLSLSLSTPGCRPLPSTEGVGNLSANPIHNEGIAKIIKENEKTKSAWNKWNYCWE